MKIENNRFVISASQKTVSAICVCSVLQKVCKNHPTVQGCCDEKKIPT
jgi:hypothetical protein